MNASCNVIIEVKQNAFTRYHAFQVTCIGKCSYRLIPFAFGFEEGWWNLLPRHTPILDQLTLSFSAWTWKLIVDGSCRASAFISAFRMHFEIIRDNCLEFRFD